MKPLETSVYVEAVKGCIKRFAFLKRGLQNGNVLNTSGSKLLYSLDEDFIALTVLVMAPIPSISTVQTSPCLRKIGGLRKQPTPGGVPVKIKSPGFNVTYLEIHSTRKSVLKI